MLNAFVIIKVCYVHNQWYDISCATVYVGDDSIDGVRLSFQTVRCVTAFLSLFCVVGQLFLIEFHTLVRDLSDQVLLQSYKNNGYFI